MILYSLYKKLSRFFTFIRAIGFDIVPFLKNLELRYSIYYLDPQTIFYSILGIVLTLILILITLKFFKTRGTGFKDALLYVFVYPGALIAAYLLAFKDWLRRDYRW